MADRAENNSATVIGQNMDENFSEEVVYVRMALREAERAAARE
jgi:hypothetical protein